MDPNQIGFKSLLLPTICLHLNDLQQFSNLKLYPTVETLTIVSQYPPAEAILLGLSCPSSHLSVIKETSTRSVPTRDKKYHRIHLTVTIKVHMALFNT